MGNTLCTNGPIQDPGNMDSRGFRFSPLKDSNQEGIYASRFSNNEYQSSKKKQREAKDNQLSQYKDIFNVIKYKNGDFYYGQIIPL